MTVDIYAGVPDEPQSDEAFASAPVGPVGPVQPLQPVRIDGAGLLEDVTAWWRRFVRTMTDADHDLLTLWAVHSHLAVECYTSPRLQLDSPMPGSGKTTVLEHLSRLCVAPVSMASVSSPALLARMLSKGLRTMLIDEADRSLNRDNPMTTEVLAILNSGYKRGGTRPVLVPVKGGGWEAEEMPTFAPVALAGNQPNLPDDTRSRIIRVLLLPDLDGTAEESDWELIEPDALALAARIAGWAETIRDAVRTCRPELPEGITGRFREKWGPLARVAEMAGGRWPAAVHQMALADKEQYEMDKDDGLIREKPAILLLRNIYDVWPEGAAFLPTAELLDLLVSRFPTSWGSEGPFGKSLTAQRMGRMLASNYKVNSARQRSDGPRGYLYVNLAAVWHRMAVASSDTSLKLTGQSGATGTTGTTQAGSAGSAGSAGHIQQALPEPAPTWTCERCGDPVSDHNYLCARCKADLMADARTEA